MNFRKTIAFFLVLLIITTAGIGCGGSKKRSNGNNGFVAAAVNPNPIIELTNNVDKSVSALNNYHIYSIISSQPDGNPEGNKEEQPTVNSFTITARFPGSSINNASINNFYSSEVYSSKQIALDAILRKTENNALASGKQELQRNFSVNKAIAPSSGINEGYQWKNVNIMKFTDSDPDGTWTTINTTCRYISTCAYFFVDDADISNNVITDTSVKKYGDRFDNIYTTDHTHFGTESDVDGNDKVIVVFSSKLGGGVLGYFYSVDKYPQDSTSSIYKYSNQGDIFYMTDQKYDSSTTDAEFEDVILATLAHEFQHMIYFDQHYKKGVPSAYDWLNEALSQAAEYYNGYFTNHNAWMKSFLQGGWSGYQRHPVPLSLTYWTDYNYGYGALFIRYLIAQYGDNAIKNMCSTQYVGIKAVEEATHENFNTIFNNFVHALVLSGLPDGGKPKIYNFGDLDLQSLQTSDRCGLLYTGPYNVGYEISGSNFPPYSICFIRWQGSFGTLNLTGNTMVGTAFGISR